jgi:hypothetical protein
MSATGAGLLRRYAPRNDSLFVVIASVAKQSRRPSAQRRAA